MIDNNLRTVGFARVEHGGEFNDDGDGSVKQHFACTQLINVR